MARQNYIVYEKTNPFIGYIRFAGQVDPDQTPDGTTHQERLTQLLVKYPDTALRLYPIGTQPDTELVKYDIATETLVPLEVGDITPKAQEVLDQAQKETDYTNNIPSWSAVNTAINNISSLADAKAFLLKLSRVVYWDVKNSKD